MTVGNSSVTLNSAPEETEPGWSIDTFSDKTQAEFKKQYFAKYPNSHYNRNHRPSPEALRPAQNEVFAPPHGYSDHFDHHLNWAHAIRSRKPVVEDGSFGFRAAGPALLSNMSYFERKVLYWDPVAIKVKEA